MKFVTKTIYIFASLIAASVFTACNDISEDDRFIELPAVEAKRVVLMEEFTGQSCVNCPDAHKVVAELVDQYEGNLISVSIHAGPLAWKEGARPGSLGTPVGEEYYNAYNIAAVPSAVVNRATGVLNVEQWASAIRTELEKPTVMDMTMAAWMKDENTISVQVGIDPYENLNGNLQIWVVESGIVSMQLTNKGFDPQYVHNHVFRGAANGRDGDKVSLVIREHQDFTYDITVKEDWNTDNLSIVAFVYDGKGVVQAFESHIAKD